MKNYNVTFAYSIPVEAKDNAEAEEKACKMWDEIVPRTDEMNVTVEKEVKQ